MNQYILSEGQLGSVYLKEKMQTGLTDEKLPTQSVFFFKLFMITVDSHAVVRNNAEVPLDRCPSFPNGSIVQDSGTVSQAGR